MTPERGPIFADGTLTTRAAALGHGVALGDVFMNAAELRDGTLVRPFAMTIPFGTYWLVAPDFDALSEPARAFADWLRDRDQVRVGGSLGRLLFPLLLDLADRIDHGVEGQHGRGMARLVVAHRLQIFQVGEAAFAAARRFPSASCASSRAPRAVLPTRRRRRSAP